MLRKVIAIVKKSRTFFLCLLSGILLALPFNNGKLWLLSWLGFIPLFILLENKSKIKAFLISYVAGIIFWSGTIYWLIHVTLPGAIILILYLAVYFGFFGLVFSTLNHQLRTTNFIFISSSWVALEYLRSHLLTGFPWALLGYSQYLNLPVIQVSDFTGAWGVSFLVMIVNVSVYAFFARRLKLSEAKRGSLFVVLIVVSVLIYGYYRIHQFADQKYAKAVKISVVQGNIPQELKWNPLSKDYILKKYLSISGGASKDRPDLIIWPEASLPVVLEEEPLFLESLKELTKETNALLLFGAVTEQKGRYYNSALLLSSNGKVLDKYDKVHLVPFGEYIPLKKMLTFLETIAPIGDIEKGKDYTVFGTPEKFSVLICFEDLFPRISREFVKKGAGFLVNITNDAWYKETPAAFQHFQASVFRAVENRVFLVRSANTGVSGFIGPEGKIISLAGDKLGKNIFIDGFDSKTVGVSKKPLTFYTRHGDYFAAVCLIFVLCGIMFKKYV